MIPKERFIAALERGIPSEVPYYESEVEAAVVNSIFGEKERTQAEISELCHRDHIPHFFFGPQLSHMEKTGSSGDRNFYAGGTITSIKDLDGVTLASPHEEGLYTAVRSDVESNTPLAVNALIGMAVDEVVLSLGLENFSYALYDDDELLNRLFTLYTDYYRAVVDNLMALGIDFLWAGSDIAYKSGPMFHPDIFRTKILPHMKKIAEHITVPWIFHSDGNILPYMNDLLSLGMNAVHPIEPEAMDIRDFKTMYGSRVCIVGNISVDLLSRGTPEQIEEEVQWRIKEFGPRGGYIISSGNSIPFYVKSDNYLRMIETIERCRRWA